jgi:phage terminase large subunit-like protein
MPDDPVTEYARSVVDGRVIAGRPVRMACQRHLDDLEHGHERGLSWVPERAQHALDFFRDFLVLPDGPNAGEPFELSSWALFTVGSMHGWWNADGYRRFTFGFVLTGKGQAKTPVGIGMAVYAMVAEGMAGAQCYVAARARTQAIDSFRDGPRILGPDLRRRLELLEHNISDRVNGGFIRPVSSEARSLEGHRVYFALLDEVGLHKNAEVVKAMQRGTKGNRDAIIFAITNAGEDRESIAWELQAKGLKVLDGIIDDDEFFAYICALDPCDKCRTAGHTEPQDACAECDDWKDETVWPKTSPLIGITIPYSYLRKEVRGALDIPSTESSVRRFNFCSWLRSESRWFTAEQWGLCGDRVNADALKGRACILGADLAIKDDLAALVLLCPDPDFYLEIATDETGAVERLEAAGMIDVLAWAWTHRAAAQQRTAQGLPYDLWEREGALFVNDGNVIDPRLIRRHIVRLRDAGYVIQEIAYDPSHFDILGQDLQDQDGFTMVPVTQGCPSLNAACTMLEMYVKRRQIRHGNNLVLRYAASNVVLERDGRMLMRPSKKKSEPHGKIDPISALVTAMKRLPFLQRTVTNLEPIMGPPRATAGMPW